MAVRVVCLRACSGPFGSLAPGQAYELPEAVMLDLLDAGYVEKAKTGKAKNKPPGDTAAEVTPDADKDNDS